MQTTFDISVPVDLQLYSTFPFLVTTLEKRSFLKFSKNIYYRIFFIFS